MKAYIASENLGIDTSAALVRKLFGRSVELGRRYARNKNEADLHEALRLLGTGCHCLEDFSAHSNYTELALIEMGERDVFPHVGRRTQVRLRGARNPVFPIVTGTFGGVDFLHSVTGEFDDKATQSEIQELEGTLQNAQQQGNNQSVLQDILSKIPDGVFGGKDEAGKANELQQNATANQMQNQRISPREPEEWLQYIEQVRLQIYPIIEWHDEIMQGITEAIEKIPILPAILEGVQEQVNIFVFSLIAPLMLPIISQIKNELNTGSNAIIQSSVEKQHIVFSDDECSDPTHSMLSKDHFSNVLNEPAGKIAGQVLKWAVPQLMQAIDNERIDIDQTLNRIIRGVFHHPALREDGEDGASDGRRLMFGVVEKWWSEKSEREKDSLRDQLSRDGVEQSRNHKPGVKDHGHGSAKKIGMPNMFTAEYPGAPGGLGNVGSAGYAGGSNQLGQMAEQAVGGGVLGSLVGGLTTAVGAGVMQGVSAGLDDDSSSNTYNQATTHGDNGRTYTTTSSSGRPGSGNYSQSQHSRTDDRFGGRSEQHTSYEQRSTGGGYGGVSGSYGARQETSGYGGGGYSSESRRHESTTTSSYSRHEETSSGFGSGRQTHDETESTGGYGGRRGDDDRPSYGRRNDDEDRPTYGTGRRHGGDDDGERPSYGRRNDDDDNQASGYGRRQEASGYGSSAFGGRQQEENYGSGGGYGGRQEPSSGGYGGREETFGSGRGFAGRQEPSSGGYGGREETTSYGGAYGSGRDETSSYGGGGGYGREDRSNQYGSGGADFGSQRRRGGDEAEDTPGGFGGGYGGSEEYGSGGGGFGGQRRRGGNESEDMPGGFGGDDEDNERRRGGYGEEYGSGGRYGRRDEY